MKSTSLRHHILLGAAVLALCLLAFVPGTARAQDAQWLGEFFNNMNLSGSPALVRWENSINFRWFGGSPDPRINDDQFSARWTRTVRFDEGNYRFVATMDDGMRVFINNQLVIDSWTPSQEHTVTVDRFMTAGNHQIRVEYFEDGGQATAIFNWQFIGNSGGGAFFPNWRAEFFNNTTLSGAPALVMDQRYLNQDWGVNSPGPGVNSDFWSARFTRTLAVQPGQYQLILTSDDGSRVWVNGSIMLDNWAGGLTQRTMQFTAVGNTVNVQVDYYDMTGPASLRVDLVPVGGTGGGGGGGTCTNAPQGRQAQSISTQPLNVRVGPSTQFEAITQLQPCQIVPLSGFRNAASTWVQIVLPSGQTGWVSADFVRLGVPMSSLQPSS